MSSGIDWLGAIVRETYDMRVCAKITLRGDVIGHYALCLVHGVRADISSGKAAMIESPLEFCHMCKQNRPRTDWDKPSDFAKALLNGSKQISFNPNDAIKFTTPTLKRNN